MIENSPEPLLDADGRVFVDLPCLRCGYNLRTLAEDSVCPECACPVVTSTRSRYLWQSPADWIGLLAGSARGLAVCIGAAVGWLLMLAICALDVQVSPRSGSGLGNLVACGSVVAMVFLPLMAIGALVGLTEADPNLRDQPEGLSSRRIVRWSLLLAPLALVTFLLSISSLAVPPVVATIVMALWLLLVVPIFTCHYLAGLMRRIPRPDLVRFARVMRVLMILTDAVWLVAIIGSLLDPWGSSWQQPFAILGLVISFGVLVGGLAMMVRIERALEGAHQRATGKTPLVFPEQPGDRK